MKKPHEQEWTTRQTHQGTWVMHDNGHAHGPMSSAVAMVYAPESRDVPGETMNERVANSDAMALEAAKVLAAAPDMARALLRNLHACSNTGSRTKGCDEAGITQTCAACETKAALRKAGVI